ncbi:monofunctional biosynthetic peptidoglycan transglycosylase [Plasticicumulans acidivorans]|nr:monofunctional biosynthetic peptidoglycan transglycosylase [Plasticicumulans acidivorans]
MNELIRTGWRRLWRWTLGTLAAAIVASVLWVWALGEWAPPFSAFMLADWLEEPSRSLPAQHWVPLAAISGQLGVAVIAAEDQRFPEHHGFDLVEIRKAIEQAREDGEAPRGASTISQQVAKNLFLWSGRSYLRKALEVWFTLLIETLWDKRRILEMYLNFAQFGDHVYGAEAAARRYFGKAAWDLSAAEAARMAAVLPNPLRYRLDAPDAHVRRRVQWILGQMNNLGGPAFLERL